MHFQDLNEPVTNKIKYMIYSLKNFLAQKNEEYRLFQCQG